MFAKYYGYKRKQNYIKSDSIMVENFIIRRFLLIGILSSLGFAHPFHVSITIFQVNPTTHSIEITLKLFSDDLEDAIHHEGLSPINLGSKNEYGKSDSLIFRYLNTNLKILLDQEIYGFNWIGKEIEHDITWSYLEIENVKMFTTAKITNSIFVSDYQDQLNITHFYKGKHMETLMHHKDETAGTIHFIDRKID